MKDCTRRVGFIPLIVRRIDHHLIQYYKVIHGLTSTYLQEHLPQTTGERISYTTRQLSHYTPFKYNTETYKNSFYPKTTSNWNLLSLQVRSARSLHEFKRLLTSYRFRPPIWYYHCPRVTNILLCHIRNGSSMR